jgi:hypothetical protein
MFAGRTPSISSHASLLLIASKSHIFKKLYFLARGVIEFPRSTFLGVGVGRFWSPAFRWLARLPLQAAALASKG